MFRLNPPVALHRAATCIHRASRVIGSCCEYRVLPGVRNDAKGALAACGSSSPVVRKTHTCRSARRALYSWGGRALSQEIYATFGSTICSSEPTRFSGILLLRWLDRASPTSLTVPSRAPGRPRCAGSPPSKSRSSTIWSLVSKARWLGPTLKPRHGDGSPRTLHAGVGTPMLPNATLSRMPPVGYASRAAWRTRQYRPIRTLAK